MAIYHCSCKVISRSNGSSAVGASAYRSGDKLTNEYDGVNHDYTRKDGVVYSEVMLCDNAKKEYQNRETLWNEVERIEKGSNAQLAREYEFALPRELSREEQIKFTKDFAHENFVKNGMCADIAIHDKGDGNPHAHIMVTMRPIDKEGNWESKSEKLYLCKNADGEERAFTSKELSKSENKEWQKQYRYSQNGNPKGKKIWLTENEKSQNPKYAEYERIKGDKSPKSEKFGKQNDTIKEWNSKEFLEQVRENLATKINQELVRKELPQRVDHRSYERQGIDKIPTIHEGKSARQREAKRINPKYKDRYKEPTEKIEINREIKKANEKLKEVKKEISDTQKTIYRIQSDMAWSKLHEACSNLERYVQQNPNDEKVQKYALEQMAKLKDNLNEMVALEQKQKVHADKFYGADDKKISYLDFHRDKAISDFEYLNAHITKNLVEIEMAKEPPVAEVEISKGTAPQQHQPEPAHADLQKPAEAQAVPFDVESVAKKLEEYREAFVKASVQSEGRTSYQENPIYKTQAFQISEYAKAYQEQSAIIQRLKDERNNLGLFQGKQKKSLDSKITEFEGLRRGNADKLKALGVSDPSKAGEAVKEKLALAEQEKVKAQTARENIGASGRAEEARNAFVSLARTVPEDKKQAVLTEIKKNIGKKDALSTGIEYKARITAMKELDGALKPKQYQEHSQSRNITRNNRGTDGRSHS